MAASIVTLALAIGFAARAGEPRPPLVFAGAGANGDALLSVVPETMVDPAVPEGRSNRFGVIASIVGLPQPVGIGAFARFHDLVGVGANLGFLPGPVGSALLSAAGLNGELSANGVEAEARLFPFRGAFFIGGAVGRMSLSASGTSKGAPVAVAVTTLYAAPRLGWLGTFSSGFTLGLDLGLQIPLSPDIRVSTSSPQASQLEAVARALAALPLPTASVKVGFLL